jgi:hypothetical protein
MICNKTPVKRQHSKIIKSANNVSTDINVIPKYIHLEIKQLSKESQTVLTGTFKECPLHYHSACPVTVALNISNADNRCSCSTTV